MNDTKKVNAKSIMHDLPFSNRETLTQIQLSKLNSLLSILRAKNRFYQQKLLDAIGESTLSSLQEFSEKIAFTTKKELVKDQLHSPPYGTNLSFPTHEYSRLSQTSGTSGKPIYWLDTTKSWTAMVDNWVTIFRYAGVTPRDRVFMPFSFSPFLGFWTAYEAAINLGCLCVPGGGISTSKRLEIIQKHGITTLCCTPTYAIRLGVVAKEEGLDMSQSKIKTIIVAGECGGSLEKTRSKIHDLWPTGKVFDHHGMTEVGPVTYQCPVHPGTLHVMESSFIPEVMETNSNKPISPQGIGELVLTTLDRNGSPVLRYRTGDLVKPLQNCPCKCGSYELALVGGIIGRVDDMLVVRGVNVYPSAVDETIRQFEEICEYQVRVTENRGMADLSICVEIERGEGSEKELEEKLKASLKRNLGLNVSLSLVAKGSLPRFELKAKRWIKED